MLPFAFSNSSAKTWRTCARQFFLSQLYGGTGLSSTQIAEDLWFGSQVHECVERLWQGPLDALQLSDYRNELEAEFLAAPDWWRHVGDHGRAEKAKEWGRMLIGTVRAYERHVLPYLRARYDMVMAEADAVRWVVGGADDGGIGLIAKPDAILHAKADTDDAYHGTGYLEFKTVASPDATWHQQWYDNPQLWTGALTLKAALGIPIDWFIVCGLVKGSKTDDLIMGKRRNTPLAWGYRLLNGAGKIPPSLEGKAWEASDGSTWSAVGTTAKGWERISTDRYPGGVEAWVAALPAEVLSKQVVLTEPVTVQWDLAEEWLGNQKPLIDAVEDWREYPHPMIPAHVAQVTQRLFPRELSKCADNGYGKPCVFRQLCHNPEVAAAPFSSGYVARQPHHPLEVKWRQQAEEQKS